jgi:hypothetical protein
MDDIRESLAREIHAARKQAGLPVILDGVYDDAYIEHWARVYHARPWLYERGVQFATFLAYPHEILRVFEEERRNRLRNPLLPAQRAVQRRLDADVDAQIENLDRMIAARGMRVSDGKAIEPMHHRCHPKHRRCRPLADMGAPS